MEKRKIFPSIFTILTALLLTLITNQHQTSACAVHLGKKVAFDMDISPKIPLFHPKEDGYLYPGGPKIIKHLSLINIGDLPFRICGINATFHGDIHLANGLQIEILELGKGKGEKPNLLYNGTLSHLAEGIKVNGKRAIPPGESVKLQIKVWMPKTAGNEYQGLTLMADISITVHFPPSHNGKIGEKT